MIRGKATLLARLTERTKMFKTAQVGEQLEGASPTIFVGRYGYPKVFIGPMLPDLHGDTRYMDTPEDWLGTVSTPEDVVSFRLQLVRGKQAVHIKDTSRITEMVKEIALSTKSTEVEAQFVHRPTGGTFNEEVQPFGPSAALKSMRVEPGKYDHQLEKAYYDTDLKAADAVKELYERGAAVSSIQRAFSVGAFGIEQNRKLVPTRWSITAVDSTLGEYLLKRVREYPNIEDYRVYEYEHLRNKFVVLMIPQRWSYESMEAFFPSIIGDKLEIFGDWEGYEKKTEYSIIGGCFYSVKMSAAELLEKEKKQATVIVLREAYSGYVPLGVWNCRECMREALKESPKRFDTLKATINYAGSRLKIPMATWIKETNLLRDILKRGLQSSLNAWLYS